MKGKGVGPASGAPRPWGEGLRTGILVWGLVLGVPALFLAFVFGEAPYRDRYGKPDRVLGAALVGEEGSERLIVAEVLEHRSEERTEYHHRLSFYEPKTGTLASRERLDSESERAEDVGYVLGVGRRYWLYAPPGEWTLRDPKAGTTMTRADLVALEPALRQPWHQSELNPQGDLLIETDDKHWYRFDPRELRVKPLEKEPSSRARYGPGCLANLWRPGGGLYAFTEVTKTRHSQAETHELSKVSISEDGQVTEVHPVGAAALSVPRFVCDERTREAVVFSNPESVLVLHAVREGVVGYSRMTLDGGRLWTFETAGDLRSLEVRHAYGDSVLLVGQRRLLSLGAADGKVRWERPL